MNTKTRQTDTIPKTKDKKILKKKKNNKVNHEFFIQDNYLLKTKANKNNLRKINL